MSESTMAGGPGRRSSRAIDLLLVAWALFIVYGTTLPLTLSAGWSDLPENIAAGLRAWQLRPSKADLVSNVALFVPLGLLLAARLVARGRGWLFTVTLATFAGCALSLCVELLQLFLPRVTSPWDLLANAAGAAAGSAVGWQFARYFWPRAAPHLRDAVARQPLATLATTAVLALFAAGLEPFRLSIDVGLVKRAVKAARLIPFGAAVDGTPVALRPWTLGGELLWWILLGGMIGLALRESGRRGALALTGAVVLGSVIAVGVELAQLAAIGRTTDATSVLLAAVGTLIGAGCTLASDRPASAWITPALGLWAATILLDSWTPPRFMLPDELPLHGLVPFYAYYRDTDVNAVVDILREATRFLPMGALLVVRGTGRGPFRAGLVGLAFGLLLETGQLFLAGRTPDVTDALSAGMGAALGYLIGGRARAVWLEARSGATKVSGGAPA